MKRFGKTTLSLLLAGSLTGCFGGGSDDDQGQQQQQLLRGHVPLSQFSADIVGVRVVSQGQTVSTAATDATGNFNIEVPRGHDYTFEIVTRTGAHTLLAGPLNGTTPTTFDVCDPGEDFDLGDINPLDFEEIDGDDVPWSDHEDECESPPWICGEETGEPCWNEPLPCNAPEADPNFCYEDPLPCQDPGADPNFCWTDPPPPYPCEGPGDPGCEEPPPWPCDDPSDPFCGELPPPCDDPGEPACEEPPHPCADPSDPNCGEPPTWICDDPNDPACEEPLPCEEPPPYLCDDPSDPNCGEPPYPCDDPSDPNCGEPPPYPCDDPSDPNCGEPPHPCDTPDGFGCEEPPFPCDTPDGFGCEEPPFPCDTPDGFGCEEPPFPHPCDGPNDPACEEPPPWDGTCSSGYEAPVCWPEPDVCMITPDGEFIECDETGAAPEFPLPDFGCE